MNICSQYKSDLPPCQPRLKGRYSPAYDSSAVYQTLYQALQEFEKDLHQHIHLENNILFPRAVALESAR